MAVNNKKNTVRRKMSMRDYVTFINFIENGDRELDLSEYDETALEKAEVRVMYLTAEQKSELPNFVKDFIHGFRTKQILNSIPKAGIGQFIQVPCVAPAAPANKADDQPEMIIGGEPSAPVKLANLPHWVKDPAGKLDPDNIDIAEIARIVENGEQSMDEIKEVLMKMGGVENPQRLLGANPSEFEETLSERYEYAIFLLDVLEFADKRYQRYVALMNEVPPTEEENAERYLDYVLALHYDRKHVDLYKVSSDSEEITSIAGNKIIFDNDDEKTLEYENVADMEHDFLNLVYNRKIGKDVQVDIFGKKMSAEKIAQKFYKKFPHGISEDRKFYHSRKEAFEDGALEI